MFPDHSRTPCDDAHRCRRAEARRFPFRRYTFRNSHETRRDPCPSGRVASVSPDDFAHLRSRHEPERQRREQPRSRGWPWVRKRTRCSHDCARPIVFGCMAHSVRVISKSIADRVEESNGPLAIRNGPLRSCCAKMPESEAHPSRETRLVRAIDSFRYSLHSCHRRCSSPLRLALRNIALNKSKFLNLSRCRHAKRIENPPQTPKIPSCISLMPRTRSDA